MSLSFLAPLAAALSVLLVLPVLAHFARQTPRDRRSFGAMMLLQRVVKRLRRRRRVKDPFLLLLRLLAVAAVIAAVMGPDWIYSGSAPEFGGSGRVVIVVDKSLSMGLADGGRTLAQQAREKAIAVVEALPAETKVGLVLYGDEAEVITPTMEADPERVLAALKDLEAGYGGSNLRGALLAARRLLAGVPGEVLVFTDEAGTEMVAAAKPEIQQLLEGDNTVLPQVVHAEPPRNVAVVGATYGEGMEGGQVRMTVANYGTAPIEVACEVTLPDGQVIPVFAAVGAQAEVEKAVTVPPEARGGVGRAWCDDPDLPMDDSRYFHLPRVGASRVLVVDGDPGDTPIRSEVYFLERALAPWGGVREGLRPDVTTPLGLSNLDPDTHRVVFLANLADPRAFGPRLTEFVRKGGNLVISLGDNVTAERYNAALSQVLPAPFRKVRDLAAPGEPGVPLTLPDTDHKLFSAFSRGGRSSFSKVRAQRVMTLEPYDESEDVHTLLEFEGGVPALVERKVGNGRVLIWTSTFDLGWSNLPLQAMFMPMVQRMVSYLGGEAGGGGIRENAFVGELAAVALPDVGLEPQVMGPDSQPVRSRVDAGKVLFIPEKPGAYTVQVEGSPPLASVAVNTRIEESDVRRSSSIAGVEREIRPDLFARRVDLSPYLYWAALVFFTVQAMVSLRRTA